MLVFLIHVRDPQFYALPAKTRAKNGNIRVMGFPPIGIMSLSAVVKRAGHECVMFDQANPDTPNDVIVGEMQRQQPALVGLSFLSTTSYPYAKMLARQIRAADGRVRLAFGGVIARAWRSTLSSRCLSMSPLCCPWSASRPCRRHAGAPGRAYSVTSRYSMKGSGGPAVRSTSWPSSHTSRSSAMGP